MIKKNFSLFLYIVNDIYLGLNFIYRDNKDPQNNFLYCLILYTHSLKIPLQQYK